MQTLSRMLCGATFGSACFQSRADRTKGNNVSFLRAIRMAWCVFARHTTLLRSFSFFVGKCIQQLAMCFWETRTPQSAYAKDARSQLGQNEHRSPPQQTRFFPADCIFSSLNNGGERKWCVGESPCPIEPCAELLPCMRTASVGPSTTAHPQRTHARAERGGKVRTDKKNKPASRTFPAQCC